MKKYPNDGDFSFCSDDQFLSDIPLRQFEVGLEIAALEERHYDLEGFRGDRTTELIDRLETIQKLREAVGELEQGLTSAAADERDYHILRYTARIMRAAFEAGRRHEPVESDTRLDELVTLFRLKIHLGAINDDALTSGGALGKKPYWTDQEINLARRMVRLEYAPGKCVDEVCGAEDKGYVCNEPLQHDGDHIADGHEETPCHRWPARPASEAAENGGGR